MMARIAVMKALNRHVERVFNPESDCPLPDNSAPHPASHRIGYGARSCRLVEQAGGEGAKQTHDR